ncbi:hypothetical protein BC936DRAFT_137845 [Jimgerdemannia flammicorona]|uniref:AIG1-type G domain-containing protein n=1 Tax=Jimgerdemannia flammicorona TaxID=994334 RepID=A0A433CWK1_9FUNG|nr:hypothetical protein BC936DRAFT_137845 [Jimgerdemannia flammicorona]
MEETSNRYRIEAPAVLLVGKTGNVLPPTFSMMPGKNSKKATLGNSLLGSEEVFEASNDPNSVTKFARAEKLTIDGRPYNLVDTPGVFDTVTPGPQTLAEIARVIGECSYGIQAIIFVLGMHAFSRLVQLPSSR